ncbi:LuxR C-terminal-related transcriptional regulator [Geodermatophilus ruber]|uniref:LuxR C-terminal-related transcriptional regulator n=1 Tax=Geodermatophilus ruber TaxID=504800 RepID=UPI000B85E204|nr:LuxR C-terminal-related transcriptional regulator [Geodermatophilus ruber]
MLTSRLAPPFLGDALLVRPRVLALLDGGVRRAPVTLISGPAGSGKTLLAASWLQEQQARHPAAWLTLDASDDEPALFWAYVTEALRGAGVELAGLEPPARGERVPDGYVPRLAACLLAHPRPVVLILDDADELVTSELTTGLHLLIRHAGTRLRLVLCARADPPLPLHQYRLTDAITEIRGDQLAFTAEETRQLLGLLGVPESPEVAAALRDATEGWAVGLRLAAAALKQGAGAAHLVSRLVQDDGSVAQYLVAEVLADQPASVRRFLLRVSVAPELYPELVDRLGGRGGARILAALARANAFVEPAAEVPGEYRIHPLFREMLEAQLAYQLPGEVAELHRVCAHWYAEEGRDGEALEHAHAAGDWQLVVALVIDGLVVSRLLIREPGSATRGLDAVPADLPGPAAAVVRAAGALSVGRSPRPEDVAAAAAAGGDAAAGLRLRACGSVVAAVAAAAGTPAGGPVLDASARAARLVAQLPDERRPARRELTAALAAARATALLRSDATDAALLEAHRAALAASEAVASRRLSCRCLGRLALLEAVQGRLRRAEDLITRAGPLCGTPDASRAAYSPAVATAAAWVCVDRNEHAEARRWMLRAQESAAEADGPLTAPLLAVLHSRLFRLRHEPAAAEDCLRPHLADAGAPRWVREQVVGEQVRVAFAHDEVAAGVGLLGELTDAPRRALLLARAGLLGGSDAAAPVPAGAELPLAVAVEAEIVRACERADAGAGAAAVAALTRALRLAAPERLRWPFLDAPPQVRRLLRSHPQLGASGAWLAPTSTAPRPAVPLPRVPPDDLLPGAAVPGTAAPVTQALSERELEVLRHLAEMLSTAEIAAAMFVSVNTVRTHIRSILRKLGVSRRNQAVRRAREIKII